MLDFAKIVGFGWDDGNSRKSADKHSVSQSEAEQIFLEPQLLVLIDDRRGGAENRFTVYGRTLEGRRLHVTFTNSSRRDPDPGDFGARHEPKGKGSV